MTRVEAVKSAHADAFQRVADLWSRPRLLGVDLFRRSEASALAEWEGVLEACRAERSRLRRLPS